MTQLKNMKRADLLKFIANNKLELKDYVGSEYQNKESLYFWAIESITQVLYKLERNEAIEYLYSFCEDDIIKVLKELRIYIRKMKREKQDISISVELFKKLTGDANYNNFMPDFFSRKESYDKLHSFTNLKGEVSFQFSYKTEFMEVSYRSQSLMSDLMMVTVNNIGNEHKLSNEAKTYINNTLDERLGDYREDYSIQEIGNIVCEIYYGMVI